MTPVCQFLNDTLPRYSATRLQQPTMTNILKGTILNIYSGLIDLIQPPSTTPTFPLLLIY